MADLFTYGGMSHMMLMLRRTARIEFSYKREDDIFIVVGRIRFEMHIVLPILVPIGIVTQKLYILSYWSAILRLFTEEELPTLTVDNGLAGRPRSRNAHMGGNVKQNECKELCLAPGCIHAGQLNRKKNLGVLSQPWSILLVVNKI